MDPANWICLLGEVANFSYTSDVDFSSIFISEANGTISTIRNLTLTQIGKPGGQAFSITEIAYAPDADAVTLTWTSNPGDTYTARFSNDITTWDSNLADNITMSIDDENNDDGEHLTKTFILADYGVENADKLFFRVEKN
ncbi:hypothetical protein V2O64_00690 [Verrucomicrobiaceae bacterium 227]